MLVVRGNGAIFLEDAGLSGLPSSDFVGDSVVVDEMA
jgi:hypothetical protein